MIVTFCGHSQFMEDVLWEEILLNVLNEKVGERNAEIYLGGYGGFDTFAYKCCKKYKSTHPNIILIFVTPYLSDQYLKNRFDVSSEQYDSIIYPEIEDKPKRFAIKYRNKWMVEKSELVISYITHEFGGAYDTYLYAQKLNKTVINIFDYK